MTLSLLDQTRWLGLLAGLFGPVAAANAQVPYDPSPVGHDSYLYHESQRLDQIRAQVGLMDEMRWRAGIPPYGEGTVYYRAPYGTSHTAPGVYHGFRPRSWAGADWGPGAADWSFGIWAHPYTLTPYPYVRTVPQPIGRTEVQTGPNRWESFPIYAEPQPVEPAVSPLPPPWYDEFDELDALPPSDEQEVVPREEPPPAASGPREF